METVRSSETSVKWYQIGWRYIPQDNTIHSHRCKKLRSNLSSNSIDREYFKFIKVRQNFMFRRNLIPPFSGSKRKPSKERAGCRISTYILLVASFGHWPWRWKQYVTPKPRLNSTGLECVTSKKTVFFGHRWERLKPGYAVVRSIMDVFKFRVNLFATLG
jgi:hypothetical protein